MKMDDIGLHLVRRSSAAAQRIGRLLLKAMPVLLALLSSVGTIAMLWVGGGILMHGLEVLGLGAPAHFAHGLQHGVEDATGALGGALGWLTYAALSAVFGLVSGAVAAVVVHLVQGVLGKSAH